MGGAVGAVRRAGRGGVRADSQRLDGRLPRLPSRILPLLARTTPRHSAAGPRRGKPLAAGIPELFLGRQIRPVAGRDVARSGGGGRGVDLLARRQCRLLGRSRAPAGAARRHPPADAGRVPAAVELALRAAGLAGCRPDHRRFAEHGYAGRLSRRQGQGGRRRPGRQGRVERSGETGAGAGAAQPGGPDKGVAAPPGPDVSDGRRRRLAAKPAVAPQSAAAHLPLFHARPAHRRRDHTR